VPPAIQCTPFTISWNLVDFLRKREKKMLCEQWALCLFLFGLKFHQFLVDLRIKMWRKWVFLWAFLKC
jgi:hypothetical protein